MNSPKVTSRDAKAKLPEKPAILAARPELPVPLENSVFPPMKEFNRILNERIGEGAVTDEDILEVGRVWTESGEG